MLIALKSARVKGYICIHSMKKFRWSAILMIVAILGITGFQVYWLRNNYNREKENLEIMTNASFRQTILHAQAVKLKLEKFNMLGDTVQAGEVVLTAKKRSAEERMRPNKKKDAAISIINLIQERMKDSLGNDTADITLPRMTFRHPDAKMIDSVFVDRKHSFNIDSFPFTPDMIRKVEMRRGKNPNSNSVVSITLDGNRRKKKGTNEFTHVDTNVFVGQFPGPAPGDVFMQPADGRGRDKIFKILYKIDSLASGDSITLKEVASAYAARLKEDHINVQFNVKRLDSTQASLPNAVTIGFSKPATFGLFLNNTFSYMLRKLKLPILFSLLLVGITFFSFILLYRNMIRQHRLGELKNEFISNITHELKTPIATVGVAIEALKNFNAIDDAARTREYLDISQNELQRLNLLVDKVLKLSVFEKKQIELKKEWFDCKQLTEEVMNSMRLQFEKYHALITLDTEGDNFTIEADKLHITSVVYNLLDNALKYSKENPVIAVRLKSKEQHIELSVTDNGIGIPVEYKGKVFEKFFRVPTGDTHNAKGYGLGLSYVSEVIKRHHGFITVDSELGKGSTFTACIPYKELPVIHFDEHRKVITKTTKIG
jgi:two-component system phosphate regulon sensor histidine kinase PhoR